ncbi:venom metalloproteinase 3-like isoform X1 [Hylaeus volcanicus]|uniref:venom metalloproteinase 3-like isoform X1 n=1 Tax=Hylaeus volcanicus TaxID=313075 RepID=UPI0023B7C77A|nr:venom metalloproteinase 3-like isoform X1 [Hylaeus volcanicus]
MYILIYLCLAVLPFMCHTIRVTYILEHLTIISLNNRDVCVLNINYTSQLHELLTPDEIMGIFHTAPDAVPDYEVVPVQHSMKVINENGRKVLHLKAFDRDIKLSLSNTEGYLASVDTPLWTVKSDQQAPEGIQYTLIPNALKDIGTTMQDEDAGASILFKMHNDTHPLFDGSLPSNLVIRSLPERVIRDVLYRKNGSFKPYFNKSDVNDLKYTYHHIIYKKIPSGNSEAFNITNSIPNKYPVPDVVYPEVLVVIDDSLYSMLGRNMEQAKRYIVAFWNGVNLRYRAITEPKIRLNIAGIIVGMDPGAIPYVRQGRFGSNLLDADKALEGMASYFYKDRRVPWKIYDLALTMTHLNLCNKLDAHLCDTSTIGYSYVAGACNRNSITNTSEAAGIVEDNGGFSGIISAAHELGHLLGSHHDENPRDPGKCSPDDDYIMSTTLVLSEKEFKWSNCSLNALRKFISEDRAKCVYDEPPRATAIRTILPGKLMTVDEQCEKVYGGGACNKNSPSICYELICEAPGTNGVCDAIAAATEGSSCGTDLICLDGQCVLEGAESKQERSYLSGMK